MDEIILLNRVRVDIGNISGSLSELMQYATLKGFNDNYEPLEKPRLVGTWTINDWYISEQLTQARNTFDGLTIIENNEFLIDFNNLAVQTLDSTQPNYNPAVAIILHNNGIGNLLDFYYHETGGKYFLTKSEAAESRNMSNKFTRKVNVADTNLIVSDTNASYTFSSFDEMLYFTNTAFWLNNQNTEHGFMYCTELVSVTFPTNVTCLGSNLNTDSYGIFYGCSKLNFPISRLANITRIPGFVNEGWGSRLGCFGGCSSLNWETISSDDLPNLTYLGSGAFMGCTKIKHVTLNLSSLNRETFWGCSGLQDLSLPNATSIPAGFCANCTSLTTLSIPQCTYIGVYAFANCGSLTTINNSTHLDELYLTCNADVGTFVKCYSLKYYASTINKEIHTQEFGGVQFMNRDLIVANSSFELSLNIRFGDCFTFQNRTNGIDTITFTNITQMCPLSFNRTSMTGNYIIRIDTNAPPILNTNYRGEWNRYPIKTNVYVGNGTASHDEALIDAYSVATNWTELYNRGMLLPWYLHEHTPALQSYNSSAPNYYPALCICFEQAGYGRYITTNNKTKGWYMSDEEAASITDTGNILKDKLTVTDVNGICGTVGATYTLTYADLSAFTNIESIDLSGSSDINAVNIANNVSITEYALSNAHNFNLTLQNISFPSHYDSIKNEILSNDLSTSLPAGAYLAKFKMTSSTKFLLAMKSDGIKGNVPICFKNDNGLYSAMELWLDPPSGSFLDFYYLNDHSSRLNGFTYSDNINYIEIGNFYIKNLTTGEFIGLRTPYSGEFLTEWLITNIVKQCACQIAVIEGDTCIYNFKMKDGSVINDVNYAPAIKIPDYSKIGNFTYNNCTNIDYWNLLKQFINTPNSELNSINITLSNTFNGPIEDLISIAALWNNQSGENSNLKISGNYIVNNVSITIAQCEAIGYNPNGATIQMSSKIYGLMVTIDPGNIIVLQSYDSNGEGYNPAVCIILEQAGYGTYVDANDYTQGWYITKVQAQSINIRQMFRSQTTVTDVNGICGSVNSTYNFTHFEELPNFISTDREIFAYCSLLTNVNVSHLTTIHDLMFFCCRVIPSIYLGENVTSINLASFEGCWRLTQITILANTPPTLGNSVFNDDSSLAHIYVPAASVDAYKSAEGWSAYASIIEAIPSN